MFSLSSISGHTINTWRPSRICAFTSFHNSGVSATLLVSTGTRPLEVRSKYLHQDLHIQSLPLFEELVWRSLLADLVLPHYFLYFQERRVDHSKRCCSSTQRDQYLQIQLIPGLRSVCLRLCQFLHALILPVSLWHPF